MVWCNGPKEEKDGQVFCNHRQSDEERVRSYPMGAVYRNTSECRTYSNQRRTWSVVIRKPTAACLCPRTKCFCYSSIFFWGLRMLRFFAPFLLLSLLSNALFLFLYKHEHSSHFKTMRSLSECQAILKDTTDKLSTLTDQHQKLKNLCELDKKLYLWILS